MVFLGLFLHTKPTGREAANELLREIEKLISAGRTSDTVVVDRSYRKDNIFSLLTGYLL